MPATIKDISQKTGLGLATISKYLNGGNVLEKNRILIDEAIKELDYTINETARNLKTKHSGYVGLLIPALSNTYMMKIVNNVQAVVRAEGWGLSLCCLHSGTSEQRRQEEIEAARFLLQKGIDGLINMPMNEDGCHLNCIIEAGIPVTLIDKNITELAGKVNAVIIDNVGACRTITDELLNAGHRKIAAVFGGRTNYTASRRYEGYTDACRQRGFEPNPDTTFFLEQGKNNNEIRNRIVSLVRNKEISAILTGTESLMRFVLDVLKDEGIKVPQDISFASIDGGPDSDFPEITSIVQPQNEITTLAGELACSNVNAVFNGKDYVKQIRTFNAKLYKSNSILNI